MAISITKYIYPLEGEVLLFQNPRFVFDNARTPEEINLVKDFIEKTLQFESKKYEKDNSEQALRLLFGFGELKDFLKETGPESYASKYYESNFNNQLYDILIETWIIVRFEDDGDFAKIVANRDELFSLMIEKKQTSYTKQYKTLLELSHLISLLGNDKNHYHGETFLLTRRPYDIFYSVEHYEVYRILEDFRGMNFLLKHGSNRQHSWTYWLDGKDKILSSANDLYSLYSLPAIRIQNVKIAASQKQSPAEKLLHIGNYLRMAYSHLSDPELMLILLVGILEYLLTRHASEESITKQFVLKGSSLVHTQNTSSPISDIGKRLELIYDKRSDFAHGNYLSNYDPKETVDNVFILFQYIKDIINSYIKDRSLVDFLKDN